MRLGHSSLTLGASAVGRVTVVILCVCVLPATYQGAITVLKSNGSIHDPVYINVRNKYV